MVEGALSAVDALIGTPPKKLLDPGIGMAHSAFVQRLIIFSPIPFVIELLDNDTLTIIHISQIPKIFTNNHGMRLANHDQLSVLGSVL